MLLTSDRRIVAVGAVMVALVSHVPAALASASVSAYASVGQTLPSGPLPPAQNHTQFSSDSTPAPIQQLADVATDGPSAQARASASASAGAGRLSVYAASGALVKTGHYDSQGNASLSIEGPSGSSEARASWQDQVTFVDASRTGQRGTATAWLNLSGAVSAYNPGFVPLVTSPSGAFAFVDGTGSAAVQVGGNGLNWTTQPWDDACAAHGLSGWLVCARSAAYDPNGTTSYSAGSFGSLQVTLDFTFGTPFALGYNLVATSNAQASAGYYKTAVTGEALGTADMSHTLLWGGISSVLDSNGGVVDNYGLVSQSGLDYRVAAAVPEPETWAMLLAGFGVLSVVGRRRGQRRIASRM